MCSSTGVHLGCGTSSTTSFFVQDKMQIEKNKEKIKKMIFNKINRFCDVHIERERINNDKIKIFKDNIKIM